MYFWTCRVIIGYILWPLTFKEERTEDSNLLLNSVFYSNNMLITLVIAITTKWEDKVY